MITATTRGQFPYFSSVDVREIKEIRDGMDSFDHKKSPEDLKMVDAHCGFTVFYGSEFRLKVLSVAGEKIVKIA